MPEINWEYAKEKAQSLLVFTYWIVGLIIIFTISYILYTRFNKQVASILVFMTSVLALYYYYVKWFIIKDDMLEPTFCPDLMTSAKALPNGQFICVDKTGTLGMGATPDISTLPENQDITKGVVNKVQGYVITPPTGNNMTDKKTFCGALKTDGISWISFCDHTIGE